MNKFLTTLLATALLSLGTAAFAADAAPAKAEAIVAAAPASEVAKATKKHHHAKKVAAKTTEVAPATPAAK